MRQYAWFFLFFLVACGSVTANQRIAQAGTLIESIAETTQTALRADQITVETAQEINSYLQVAQNSLAVAVVRMQSGRTDESLVYLDVAMRAIEEAILLRERE